MRSSPRRKLLGMGVMVCALTMMIGATTVGPATAAPATKPLPVGNVFTGLAAEMGGPSSMPPGSDNWACHVSAQHPYPVVLVHGTIANQALSWQALSPMLANAGYCVYGFNYGATSLTFGRVFGLA